MGKEKKSDIERIRERMIGPVPSISTPFLKDGAIDWQALRGMIDLYIESGVQALLITPGDSLLSILTESEIAELNIFVLREVRDRALVINSGFAWGLGMNLELARLCREAGSELYIPYPSNWAGSCGAATLTDFYRAVGAVLPIMVLTNLGGGAGVPREVYTALMEDRDSGFAAVKDDMPLNYGIDLMEYLAGRIPFMTGGTAKRHLAVRAWQPDCYLSVFTRFWPEVDQAFWSCYLRGNLEQAAHIVKHYETALMGFFAQNGLHFDAGIHGCLEYFGRAQRWRRAPYTSATEEQMERLGALLGELQQSFAEDKKLLKS